jgi:hypothetical protein
MISRILRQKTGSLPEADREGALAETEMAATAPPALMKQRLADDA